MTMQLDVTDFVQSDWDNVSNHRPQFRVLAGSNDDDETDYWNFQRNNGLPALIVNYLAN